MRSPSLHQLLQHACAKNPQATALMAPGKSDLDYSGLMAQIESIAQLLLKHEMQSNDVAAVVMANGDAMAVTCLGVACYCSCAPLNPEYSATEMRFYLEDLNAKLLLLDPLISSSAAQVAEELGISVIQVRQDSQHCGILKFPDQPEVVTQNAIQWAGNADVALLLHTSGTSAQPKLVPLSHTNLATTADNLKRCIDLQPIDRCFNSMPMFHIGALVDMLVAPLASGGSTACVGNFDVYSLSEWLDTLAPSWIQWPPILLQQVLDHYLDNPQQLSALKQIKLIRIVAAALPPQLQQQFESLFHVPVVEVYGMTESTTLIASQAKVAGKRIPGSVGVSAGPEIAIADADGNHLAANLHGEILLRGPSVMHGYRGPAAVNQNAFFDDWFRTGDFGYLDHQGHLFILGRLKEIVNRGGEKISPREVDEALQRHPEIVEAGCFGLPHPQLGEELAAAVILANEHEPDWQTVNSFLRQQLAYFKIPSRYFVVTELPKTSTGKLQRHQLALQFAEQAALQNDQVPILNSSAKTPQTPQISALMQLWCEILGCSELKPDDDFFDLGGDSLKAMSLTSRIKQLSGVNLFVTALFDYPIFEEFEQHLKQQHPEIFETLEGEAQNRTGRHQRAPLSEEQIKFSQLIFRPISRKTTHLKSKNPPAVFVLSPPRSGSTLLRIMLAGNSRLFAPPELYLLNFDNLRERYEWFADSAQRGHLEGNIRALMELHSESAEQALERMQLLEQQQLGSQEYLAQLQAWAAPRMLVDKTPFYASHIDNLKRAELYCEKARYIHLTRHPLAMMRSFMEVRMDLFWYQRLLGDDYAKQHPNPFDASQMAELVWLHVHRNITDFLAEVDPERHMQIRYEDLVLNPEQAMQQVCAFLEIDYNPTMIQPYSKQDQRMTDGLYSHSQMIGDIKFFQHQTIQQQSSNLWKSFFANNFLNPQTLTLARQLGYRDFAVDTPSPVLSHDIKPASESRNTPSAVRTEDRKPSLTDEIVAVWTDVLRPKSTPGLDDDFRDLGGNSLLSMELLQQLEKRLGQTLPLVQLSPLSTIRQLSATLEHYFKNPQAVYSDTLIRAENCGLSRDDYFKILAFSCGWPGICLAPGAMLHGLNTTGHRTPIFWCFQTADEFLRVAHSLGDDQPLFGMRSGHLAMDKNVKNIQALACFYAHTITAMKLPGLIIGGACQAAKIAARIAIVLEQLKQKIELLILQEQFIPLPYHGETLFLFGKDCLYNPINSFPEAQKNWSKIYPNWYYSTLQGKHGTIYEPDNIADFVATIRRAIDTKKEPDGRNLSKVQALAKTPVKAELELASLPQVFAPGDSLLLPVMIKNTDDFAWHSARTGQLRLCASCIPQQQNNILMFELGRPLKPGLQPDATTLALIRLAIPVTAGEYRYEIDLFGEQGPQALSAIPPAVFQFSVAEENAPLGFSHTLRAWKKVVKFRLRRFRE